MLGVAVAVGVAGVVGEAVAADVAVAVAVASNLATGKVRSRVGASCNLLSTGMFGIVAVVGGWACFISFRECWREVLMEALAAGV